MMNYQIAAAIVLLMPGASSADETISMSDSRYVFSFVVADKATFRSEIKEVTITSRKTKREIQRIELPSNEGNIPDAKPIDYLPDVNFDGYSDLAIHDTTGAGPNSLHIYYVFDPKSESFARDGALEAITSATFLPKTKSIRSFWASGCCYHGENIYKYHDKKLVLVIERRCEPALGIDGVQYLSTVKKMKKGKMLLVKKRYLTDDYVSKKGFGW